MKGRLFDLLGQRRSSRGGGSLDIIPTGRHPLMADMIVFLSLGKWEDYNENTLMGAALSALRSLLASSLDEFATILMGGRQPDSDGYDVAASLRPMIRGFMQALREDPEQDRFRRIVIVEQDIERLRKIHKTLQILVQDDEGFADTRTTLIGTCLPERTRLVKLSRAAIAVKTARSNVVTLSMKALSDDSEKSELVAMLRPAQASGAAIAQRKVQISDETIAQIYHAARVATENRTGVRTAKQLAELAEKVSRLLPPDIISPLDDIPPNEQEEPRLEFIHDPGASRVPWEALRLKDGRHTALLGGISRRPISTNCRKLWLPAPAARLRVLIVIDPTDDLANTRKEGKKICNTLASFADITKLTGEEASLENVRKLLNEQIFDIFHYGLVTK